jgi:UPF0755 protein
MTRRGGRVSVVARLAAIALLAGAAGCEGAVGGAPVHVTIPRGSSTADVADSLAHDGVITSARNFRIYVALRGGDRGLRAGTYLMRRGEGFGRVLNTLRGGRGIVAVIPVPEGFAISQIEPLLVSRLHVPRDSADAAVRDTALLRELDLPTPTLEGYLFPDTYIFPEGTSARDAVRTMVHRFEEVWQPAWTRRLDTLKMSRNDVMTLASIVEKEARLPEERPVIAAVYMNRLRDGVLLQADPTVQYALGHHTTRLLYKDLEVQSAYNTYKHPGLPPGPIASPGKPSIMAALYPAQVPFEFFVAFPDGHHEFRKSFAEHSVAVAASRRAWDSVAVARRADSLRRAGGAAH